MAPHRKKFGVPGALRARNAKMRAKPAAPRPLAGMTFARPIRAHFRRHIFARARSKMNQSGIARRK
jgi:hypothetical protein